MEGKNVRSQNLKCVDFSDMITGPLYKGTTPYDWNLPDGMKPILDSKDKGYITGPGSLIIRNFEKENGMPGNWTTFEGNTIENSKITGKISKSNMFKNASIYDSDFSGARDDTDSYYNMSDANIICNTKMPNGEMRNDANCLEPGEIIGPNPDLPEDQLPPPLDTSLEWKYSGDGVPSSWWVDHCTKYCQREKDAINCGVGKCVKKENQISINPISLTFP